MFWRPPVAFLTARQMVWWAVKIQFLVKATDGGQNIDVSLNLFDV